MLCARWAQVPATQAQFAKHHTFYESMDTRNIARLLVLLAGAALAAVSGARAQDPSRARRHQQNSIALDAMAQGPAYQFTGSEDPALLAAIFRQTLRLGKSDAGGLARPQVQCLALGRWAATQDPSAAVLDSLAKDSPPTRPASSCAVNDTTFQYAVTDRATGVRGWLLRITALRTTAPDTVHAWTDFYVRPLFAAGWRCTLIRRTGRWYARGCEMRWIS